MRECKKGTRTVKKMEMSPCRLIAEPEWLPKTSLFKSPHLTLALPSTSVVSDKLHNYSTEDSTQHSPPWHIPSPCVWNHVPDALGWSLSKLQSAWKLYNFFTGAVSTYLFPCTVEGRTATGMGSDLQARSWNMAMAILMYYSWQALMALWYFPTLEGSTPVLAAWCLAPGAIRMVHSLRDYLAVEEGCRTYCLSLPI